MFISDTLVFNATDVFDSVTGKWSTAELSVAREAMGAVSVGRFAIFAGGLSSGRTCLSRLWAVWCWILFGALMLMLLRCFVYGF